MGSITQVHLILFMLISCTFSCILLLIDQFIWTKTTKRFLLKKTIDCVIPILEYSILVYAHFISQSLQLNGLVIFELFIAGMMLYFSIQQILFFSHIPPDHLNTKTFPSILTSLLFSLLFGIATINYVSYSYFPNSYIIPSGLSHVEIGFEFVYYTFMLMLTYSGDTISVASPWSKTLQMLEISLFYFLVAICVTELVNSYKTAQTAER